LAQFHGDRYLIAMADCVWIYEPKAHRLPPYSKDDICAQSGTEGLATVFPGAVDYPKLTQNLRLPHQQFVTFVQTVGYPRA